MENDIVIYNSRNYFSLLSLVRATVDVPIYNSRNYFSLLSNFGPAEISESTTVEIISVF